MSELGPEWDAVAGAIGTRIQDVLGRTTPPGQRRRRNKGWSEIGERTSDGDLAENFDPDRGCWTGGTKGKPARFLVILDRTDAGWKARLPAHERGGAPRIGYSNLSSGPLVVSFGIVPAFHPPMARYTLHMPWKWMLFFCFAGRIQLPPHMPESSLSGITFTFDPRTGTLWCHKEGTGGEDGVAEEDRDRFEAPYIAAGLVKLRPDDDVFELRTTDGRVTITYGEATNAIADLLRVRPRAVRRVAP